MRVPRSWLEEYVTLDMSDTEIATRLDSLGFEVEGVEAPGAEILGVIIAKILAVDPHPNADRLQLATVTTGDREVQVVCGAPNIAAGMVVPFAPSGASLPGGFTLDRRKIRGIESDGMLCSARELGLGEDHSGILELPADAPLGADVRPTLGLNDVVFDLSITPNRPDAMSIVGIARELAAAYGVELRTPTPPVSSPVAAMPEGEVHIDAPTLCQRFVARAVRVQVGPSPEWMQSRLRLAGMRPINNVVDVTNYVLLELGRPLHAFDAERIAGKKLVARAARPDEQITTLDGVTRTMGGGELLIVDGADTPQAIAGVMGGAAAEVREDTTSILLESAYFTPSSIASTAKHHQLRSEASARFERGIDPNSAVLGVDRAVELLTLVASGVAEAGHVDCSVAAFDPQVIALRPERTASLLGMPVSPAQCVEALSPLGMECSEQTDGTLSVSVPTWRPDLEREIDLIEEVARRIGFDRIPRSLPAARGTTRGLTRIQQERRLVQDVLVGAGIFEAMTLPLVNPVAVTAGGWDAPTVQVANPLRSEESSLRAALLPGLLSAAGMNAAHGTFDLALFELGMIFRDPGDDSQPLPTEEEHVAGVLVGAAPVAPSAKPQPYVPQDAVGVIQDLFGALRIANWSLSHGTDIAGFDPTAAATVIVDGNPIGAVGALRQQAVQAVNVDRAVIGFELNLEALHAAARTSEQFQPYSKFPPARFDLAFLVPGGVSAEHIVGVLRSTWSEWESEVRCFDVFQPADSEATTSLTFSVALRKLDSTLTDGEISEARAAGIAAVAEQLGATLRS